MISFQFSPVRIIKIVINDDPVPEKSYLEGLSSSSFNSPEKNCLARSELINRKSPVRTAKFVIDDNDSSTVESRILSEVQDLIILKTLRSLKALSTESPEFSSAKKSSKRLTHTMTPSKMLKPSYTYFLRPSPKSLRTISIANMTVKI